MIESHQYKKYLDVIQNIAKIFFELIRNSLIVGTIAYFDRKSDNKLIHYLYMISITMLAVYIGAIICSYQIKASLFSNTTEGRVFGFILSVVASFLISNLIMQMTIEIIIEGAKAQMGK